MTPIVAPRPPAQGEWTYQDFVRFVPDNVPFRYEIIEGHLCMSPSPQTRHQMVLNRLNYQFLCYAEQSNHAVMTAPCDVLLGDDDRTVVEPDILMIHGERRGIIEENFIIGPPDLLVEVLSPTNREHDLDRKFRLYLKHRVPEYWVVDPSEDWLEVFYLRGGDTYAASGRLRAGLVESEAFARMRVNVEALFTR